MKSKHYVSVGSGLVNAALSGSTSKGIKKGRYVLLVGDSESAKSWVCASVLAEASVNPHFKDYALVYQDPENGMTANIEQFFGKELAKRIQFEYPDSIEHSYDIMENYLDQGPCIIIQDSNDALDSEADLEKSEEDKKKRREGKDIGGSYGTGKAKVNSLRLKPIVKKLKKTNSILIIISQTRDNLAQFTFDKKTRSGGKALKFYAHMELWTSSIGKITKTINGKTRTIGANIQFDVKKNRSTGWHGKVEVPFFRKYGLDDIGSCIDFLVEEKHWSKGKVIKAPELKLEGSKEKLIADIEAKDKVEKLYEVVQSVWDQIEEASLVKRKPKYG